MIDNPWFIWKKAIAGKNKEAYTNFFNCLKERNLAKPIVSSYPYLMSMDPVGYCNLHCPFCPTGTGELEREKTKMHFSVYKKIMDQLGPYLFNLNLFNWGEPFLNSEIPEIIKYAKNFHIFTQISSNLSIPLSEEQLNKIVSSGLDTLLCSIDGASQETYQKYRVGGNFDLVIKNMKLLKEIKKEKGSITPYIVWQFMVFRHNEHELEKAQKKAEEIGVKIKFVKPYVYENQINWISTIPKFSEDVSLRNRQTKETKLLHHGEINKIPINNNKPCTWLWSSTVINANGSISPCCGISSESDDFGKIDEPFEDIRNNKNYRSAREIFTSNKSEGNTVCHRCPVPDIQQALRYFDEQIIVNLLQISPQSDIPQIMSELKQIDNELYNKMIDITGIKTI